MPLGARSPLHVFTLTAVEHHELTPWIRFGNRQSAHELATKADGATMSSSRTRPKFTYLGYEFRQRAARNKHGQRFSAFLPAISKHALKRISAQVRSWRLHHRTGDTFADLARWINPIVRGWMQYYGAFYRSALSQLLTRINTYLVRWIRKKYKRLRAREESHRVLAGDHRAVSRHVRALGLDSLGRACLTTRMTRAR